MVEAWLPYGQTEIAVRVPDEYLGGIINNQDRQGAPDPIKMVSKAIENPLVGSRSLEDIVTSNQTIAVVVDDDTRPAPTKLLLSCLLKKLSDLDIKTKDVHIIIGTGTHSLDTDKARMIIGEEYFDAVHVHIHDCHADNLVYMGKTSFGTDIHVNKIFMDADIRILTGDIGFHYCAGYSGGRKSVLPAIVGYETIKQNHALLLSPQAITGRLNGNPVHEDMNEALEKVNVDFAINVVQNSHQQIVEAFAGDVKKIFIKGVSVVDEMYKVSVEAPADIVIVSPGGRPFDIDLYRAYKGIDSAINVVKKNGVIILVAECLRGYSCQVFYEWMLRYRSLARIRREIKKNYIQGSQQAYYLMNAQEKAKIILVSVMPDYYATGVFKLRTAKTANAALRLAFRIVGHNRQTLIIPNGSTTLPMVQN